MSLLPQYHCGTRDKNDNEEDHYQNSLKDNIKCSKIHKKLKSEINKGIIGSSGKTDTGEIEQTDGDCQV